jgi:hypothetical protein
MAACASFELRAEVMRASALDAAGGDAVDEGLLESDEEDHHGHGDE